MIHRLVRLYRITNITQVVFFAVWTKILVFTAFHHLFNKPRQNSPASTSGEMNGASDRDGFSRLMI
jgi:phosphotransferase system  glucose/maltose/N-acetylglucosamine-specific IIC component